MKRMIAVQIEPDDDGKRCGACVGSSDIRHRWCDPQSGFRGSGDDLEEIFFRGPECLAAQTEHDGLYERAQSANDCSKCGAVDKAKLRALIGAGKTLRRVTVNGVGLDELGRLYEYCKAWDAALAALEGKP